MKETKSEPPILEALTGAAEDVVKSILKINPMRGQSYSRDSASTWGQVTGLIQLKAASTNRFLVISFEEDALLPLASALLMKKFDKINPEVVDVVGEITNMVCGHTKNRLSNYDTDFAMTRPTLIEGENVPIVLLENYSLEGALLVLDNGRIVVETAKEREGK